MKNEYRKAFKALEKLGVPVFERSDYLEGFFISAEDEESYKWVDYWEPRFEREFTHPLIQETLRGFGLYAEWENPGCLGVYE